MSVLSVKLINIWSLIIELILADALEDSIILLRQTHASNVLKIAKLVMVIDV